MRHAVRNGILAGFALALCLGAAADHLVLQVEDFDGPWRRQTNISGFLGNGFCTSNAKGVADSVMTYKGVVRECGTHIVYARGYTSSNSRRAFQVEVNGHAFEPTHDGTERRWSWARLGEVNLPKGNAAVVVKDAADGFESVDAIVITDNKEFDPAMLDEAQTRWRVYGDEAPEAADPLRFVIEACCAASAARKDYASKAEWEAAKPRIKQELGERLGLLPYPEKTPLNARVVGRAERDLYTIENVVFESRPGFVVTANVYVPKDVQLPAPAVLVVAGHDMENAKNCPTYQMGQLGLVRQGFVVMAHDPIGQGERRVPGQKHELGYGSLLVGRTNEGYIVWDTIRALDYLTSRTEVDAERVGLAGNSGGGENVFYTMPFDERVQAGGSFSFVCSYEEWIRHGGNHCICNHFPGIVHYMEEFEIIGLNAPRPFLAGNGLKDSIFPIAGTRETVARAKKLYAFYGVEDRVHAAQAEYPHGWHPPLREAAYGWMNKWLQGRGDGSPVPEADYEPNDPKSPDVLCFEDGKVPADSQTVVTLNRKAADAYRAAYAKPSSQADGWDARAEDWRARIWDVCGGRPAAAAPTVREVRAFEWEGCHVEVLSLATEPGMEVGAVFIRPGNAAKPSPVALLLSDQPGDAIPANGLVASLVAKGLAVCVLHPRGWEATGRNANHLVSDAICLGRPLFAMQVWDTLQTILYLQGRDDVDASRIRCHGMGAFGLVGVYAAALGGELECAAAERMLASYRFFLEDGQPQSITLCVPNILKVADVPQVVALAAPTPLLLSDVEGYGRTPLPLEEAREELAFAENHGKLRVESGADVPAFLARP